MNALKQQDVWGDYMRAVLAGDQAAYRHLLEELARAIRAQVRAGLARFGHGNADIEDIVQDVLLAVHLKKQTWDPALPFAPWVNAIARYKLTDNFRRKGARNAVPIDDLTSEIAAPADESEDFADADRLIGQLDGRAQHIVRAISLNGKSVAEVGRELNMQEGAVRVALHRALGRLARLYRA